MSVFKTSNEQLTAIVKESFSFREVVRKCGAVLNSGSTYAHYKKRVKNLNLNTSHFKGKGNNFGPYHIGGCEKKGWRQRLIKRNSMDRAASHLLRRSFSEYCTENNIDYKCSVCSNDGNWMGYVMKLEISHKDDDRSNNQPTNLEWICPNCHSIKNGPVC